MFGRDKTQVDCRSCPYSGRESIRNKEDGHTYSTCRFPPPDNEKSGLRMIDHTGRVLGWVGDFSWMRDGAWCGRHPDLKIASRIPTMIELDAGQVEDKGT